jgi:hypothetical protein
MKRLVLALAIAAAACGGGGDDNYQPIQPGGDDTVDAGGGDGGGTIPPDGSIDGADLALALAATPNPVAANGTLTYTIDLTNRGAEAVPFDAGEGHAKDRFVALHRLDVQAGAFHAAPDRPEQLLR